MFSYLSWSSTSLATVTPSLVTRGEPNDFSMITFRPRGPRVTLTASVSMSTPTLILARASSLNLSCFAIVSSLLECVRPVGWCGLLRDDREDVVLAQDQVLHSVDLDLRAGVFPEQDAVARLHLGSHPGAVVRHLAGAHGNDQAFLRLLLCAVGDDDPALGLGLLLHPLDQNPVLQRLDFHAVSSFYLEVSGLPAGVSTRCRRVLATNIPNGQKRCQGGCGD